MYGIGWLIYWLLWGRAPLRRQSTLEQIQAILHEQVTVLGPGRPEVPEELGALVLRMLAKKPAARPPDGAEALAALDVFHGPQSPPSELKSALEAMVMPPGANSQ